MNKILKNINASFRQYEDFFLIIFLATVSIASISYFYFHNEILLYNDARGHLDIARRIIDSLTPGFVQIGSVWLPLYQLLEIPFVWNNFLWHSGLAGSIISGLSYIGASYFIYKILKKLTNSTFALTTSILFFALNPNLLYLQSVPLDEVLMLFLINGSLYFLLSWAENNDLHNLLLSALFVFLGSLVRYEVWFLAIFEIFYVVLTLLDKNKIRSIKKIESSVIIFSTLAFFGIFIWLLYNFLIWHNALYFVNGQYSAQAQQSNAVKAGILKTNNNIVFSTLVYASDIGENTGYVFGIAALFGLIYLLYKSNKTYIKLFYLVTLGPLLFDLISLYKGITVIYTKLIPSSETGQVFNTRYGILGLIPVSIILAVTFFSLWKKSKYKIFIYMIIAILWFGNSLYFYLNSPVSVINDGLNGVSAFGKSNNTLMPITVKANCSQGLTLISAGKNDAGMFATTLPMKSFIYEGSGNYWDRALLNPQSLATCIVMSYGDVVYQNFSTKQKLLNTYKVIYNSTDTKVYKSRK